MSMTDVPSSERLHIGFFGARNAGKSSVVNKVTSQELSVVSGTPGTTTDPVRKAMELLPIGPVVVIDTPGLDDTGELGKKRVLKTKEILKAVDLAVLVTDITRGYLPCDLELMRIFRERNVPFIICRNKSDLAADQPASGRKSTAAEGLPGKESTPEQTAAEPITPEQTAAGMIDVSAKEGTAIRELLDMIGRIGRKKERLSSEGLLSGLISPGDVFLLVIPIDESAPKGRLILPQQMMLHEVLSHHAVAVTFQTEELRETLSRLRKEDIRMVITDSQAFHEVASVLPPDMPLTSFSILMARYKGVLEQASEGVKSVLALKDGDRILMAEGCTHHRQCRDIGTVKIPGWLRSFTGKHLLIETASGQSFPDDLSPYSLIIHCGGCMLNKQTVMSRMEEARAQGIPMTNYGLVIAYMNGILERSEKALAIHKPEQENNEA